MLMQYYVYIIYSVKAIKMDSPTFWPKAVARY